MQLKCVVIGMGLLGSQHAAYLSKYEKTSVAAVCDLKPEKAQTWAEKHGTAYYSEVKKMLEEIKPDLAVIATQDPYHKEPIITACQAGIPYIISEKPLTTTVEDAVQIKEAAEKSGTQIKVLFPNRFYPLDRSIRLLVSNDYLGVPQYGEMRLDDAISVPLRLWGADSGHFAKISSPAYFLLSHAVDLLRFYFAPREILKVYAVGKKGVIGSDVDYVDSFLTFDDGLVIRLKTEWTKRLEGLVENYVQLTASKGGFVFNKTPGYGCSQGLRISVDGNEANIKKASSLLAQNGISSDIKAYDEGKSFALELLAATEGNDFDWNMGICRYVDSFLGQDDPLSPATSLDGGMRQVAVVDAILRSVKTGKEIEVEYL